jgi:hypothetical protein
MTARTSAQRECASRAIACGPASDRSQFRWNRFAVDHGVSPFVERDGFGQQLGAVAVGVARDGIDQDSHAAHVAPRMVGNRITLGACQ